MINLAKIADLAKDTSASGRKSLVGMLTDFFLESGEDRDEQISLLFGDIVLQVMGQLEEETKMILAKRVCREEDAPHALMKHLASEDITVAEPILENSPVLTSEDLVEIASSASMSHLGAIAGRKLVDPAVTSVLVERGDDGVLTKVSENKGASFAEDSFLKLVEKARNNEALLAALVTRPDLPDEAGKSLIPMLTEELRERISALGADSTLVQLMAERAATEVAARAQKIEDAREQSNSVIRDVVAGKTQIDAAVTMFARADRTAELGMLLAKVSDLPPAAVSQLLFSVSDKPLIIVCKAIGVPDEAYKDILTMRARRLGMGGHELNEAINRYASLSLEGAKRSLETIRQSGGGFGGSTDKKPKTEKPASPAKKVPFAANR